MCIFLVTFRFVAGHGGTSTTGNVVHALLSSEIHIEALVNQVPEQYQHDLHDCVSRLYTIVKIYNGSSNVDVEKFRNFCFDTKVKILTQFPHPETDKRWIYLTPTVHGLLDHSSDLIAANGACGLASSTESSLESNNKVLRLARVTLSRKQNQFYNLSDCFQRLWVRSDYLVRSSIPKNRGKTKEDFLQLKANKLSVMPFQSLSNYYLNDLIS